MSDSTIHTSDWRQSKWLAIVEPIAVALIFLADERRLIPFSKTPFLLALGWVSLRVRGIGWRRVGLTLYKNWRTTLALGLIAGVLLECLELFITQPILVKWLHKQPNLETFHQLRGNIAVTLIFIALAWTLAAFGEEMVYRGYLMNRVAELMNCRSHGS